MTATSSTTMRWHRNPTLLLAFGATLLFLAHFRWGVGGLAWIAPVPLLRFLRVTWGWRPRVVLAGVLLAAWIATSLKIVTAPLSPVFAVPVGIGIGAVAALAYLGWDVLRRRVSADASVLAFAALATIVEWAQHAATPLASWGAAAYTQLSDLPLLQVASLVGMAGVSFIVYWVAAWLEATTSALLDGAPILRVQGLALAAVLLGGHAWGAVRLREVVPGSSVRVAAVGTTATFTGFPIPERRARDAIVEQLLADTARAAESGARLVVWNEAATVVLPGDEERKLNAAARESAGRHGIDLVTAYIVPRSEQPPSFENKLVWLSSGTVSQVYEKHHPAPGEPAVVGTGSLVSIDAPFGRAGGAICYDYDYPAMGLEHARLGVGLVALPSSDWRGIDPIHTQMAALRAIEGGFSLVRSTRFGTSGAIDAHGRFRALQSAFDGGDRVMLGELPARPLPTLYSRVGDTLVWACITYVVVLLASALARAGGRDVVRDAPAQPSLPPGHG